MLHRIGLDSFVRLRARRPSSPIYWGFVALTLNSYLLVARNLREFWPRPGMLPPPHVRRLMDAVGSRYPGYAPERGCVSLPGIECLEGFVHDGAASLRDPLVRFFRDSNPRSRTGEALVCLCPVTLGNWASALGRLARKQ